MAISLGGVHSCAALADGTAKCWGSNGDGQLAKGGLFGTSSSIPVTVCSEFFDSQCQGVLSAVNKITAGGNFSSGAAHTCALRAGGQLRCSGANGSGQLGDGTTDAKNLMADSVKRMPMVLLLHGFNSSCGTLGTLRDGLMDQLTLPEGNVRCYDYGSLSSVKAALPGLWAEFIEIRRFLFDFKFTEDIYIVAHSYGGIVSRTAVELMCDVLPSCGSIGSVIMLGTPNQGFDVGWIG